MTVFVIKAGEVICIASGIYDGYDRKGPFIAAKEFDLIAFIDTVKTSNMEPWQISSLMYELPELLVERGLITKTQCRNIYLGAFGELEVGEEREDYT